VARFLNRLGTGARHARAWTLSGDEFTCVGRNVPAGEMAVVVTWMRREPVGKGAWSVVRIEKLADQPERRTIGARSAINAQQTTTTINARVRVNACATKPINGGPARSPA